MEAMDGIARFTQQIGQIIGVIDEIAFKIHQFAQKTLLRGEAESCQQRLIQSVRAA
jgi:hypothetical protein